MIEVYGIPNCDTVKKARAWLGERGIAYTFHDYKKEGADPERLAGWVAAVSWEAVLNRRGTTFRKLPESEREGLDPARAASLMQAHPSAIRRPIVEYPGGMLVGFDPAEWTSALA
ncbi:arsenate reductase [Tsuneonella sp. HG222]